MNNPKVKLLVAQSDSLRPHGLTVAHQALLPMEFSRQEYWSGYINLQEIFLTQRPNPVFPHCRQILCCLNHQGMILR